MPRGGLAGCQGCVWWRERGGWLCVGGVGRCWLGGCVWCVWGWGREGCEEERRGVCGVVVGCVLLAGGSLLAGRPTHPLSLPPPPPAPLLLLLLLTTPLASPPSPPPSLPSFPLPTTLAPRPHTRWPFAPPSSPSPSLSLSPFPSPLQGRPHLLPPLFPTRRAVQAVCAGASRRGRRGEVSGWRVCGCVGVECVNGRQRVRGLSLSPVPSLSLVRTGGESGRGGRSGGRPSSPEGAGRVCGSDRGVVCGVWCVVWCGGVLCVCVVCAGGWWWWVGPRRLPAAAAAPPHHARTRTHTHTHTQHAAPRCSAAPRHLQRLEERPLLGGLPIVSGCEGVEEAKKRKRKKGLSPAACEGARSAWRGACGGGIREKKGEESEARGGGAQRGAAVICHCRVPPRSALRGLGGLGTSRGAGGAWESVCVCASVCACLHVRAHSPRLSPPLRPSRPPAGVFWGRVRESEGVCRWTVHREGRGMCGCRCRAVCSLEGRV